MELEWMGRYRPLIIAITEHGAVITSEEKTRRRELEPGIAISIEEWEILVCVIDLQEKSVNMNEIVAQLKIPQSSFSKMVKNLCSYGLVEKYKGPENRKNVLLRPTEAGLAFYRRHSEAVRAKMFGRFLDALKDVSDEDLARFTMALNMLNEDMYPQLGGSNDRLPPAGKEN